MSIQFRRKPLVIALGTAVLAGGIAASSAVFAATDLAAGYQLASAGDKSSEGKCGEAKCGADKKGAKAKGASGKKPAEGKLDGDKQKDGNNENPGQKQTDRDHSGKS